MSRVLVCLFSLSVSLWLINLLSLSDLRSSAFVCGHFFFLLCKRRAFSVSLPRLGSFIITASLLFSPTPIAKGLRHVGPRKPLPPGVHASVARRPGRRRAAAVVRERTVRRRRAGPPRQAAGGRTRSSRWGSSASAPAPPVERPVRGAKKFKQVAFTGVCDVDGRHLKHAVEQYKKDGYEVKGYKDFRELLARKDIDAVIIAMPDHWHALDRHRGPAQGQGRLLREAADPDHRGSPRAEEGGRRTPARCSRPAASSGPRWAASSGSPPSWSAPAGSARSRRSSAGSATTRMSGPIKAVEPPKELDWDMWLGPTAKVPYRYENGEQDELPLRVPLVVRVQRRQDDRLGAHHLDIAQWCSARTAAARSGSSGRGDAALRPTRPRPARCRPCRGTTGRCRCGARPSRSSCRRCTRTTSGTRSGSSSCPPFSSRYGTFAVGPSHMSQSSSFGGSTSLIGPLMRVVADAALDRLDLADAGRCGPVRPRGGTCRPSRSAAGCRSGAPCRCPSTAFFIASASSIVSVSGFSQYTSLPLLHRVDGDERVPVVGHGDDDRVHVLAVDQLRGSPCTPFTSYPSFLYCSTA